MNELIKIENGTAVLDPEMQLKIADFEREIKRMKEAEDALKSAILVEMASKGIKKIETDELQVIYKDSYDKETFQSKEFRADHADLYDAYVKMTQVKPSITIKLKEGK